MTFVQLSIGVWKMSFNDYFECIMEETILAFMMEDEKSKFMKMAIDLADHSVQSGGGPFGAVVVKDGKVIGKGHNQVTSNADPTAHAEVMAIRDACQQIQNFELQGCQLYTSCEPCPMCLGAIYWSRVDVVYYANTQSDAAAIGFDDQFIYDEIAINQEQRKIPFLKLDIPSAIATFNAWANKEDKIEY